MEYLAIPTAAHICGSVYNFRQERILSCFRIFSPIGIFDVSHVSVGKKFRLDFHKAYTVFPRIIAGGDYFLFRPERALRLFEGGRLFQILLTRSRALNIFPLNKKIITSNKTELGLFKHSKFSSWLIFIAWIVTDPFCWITLHFNPGLQLDREGWGHYLREAIILNIYGSREAINRGTAIIRGNKVPKQL